jgi:phenylalanyl-tRNA synthetase alpha chain
LNPKQTKQKTDVITGHPANNVTDAVFDKIGANLHRRPDHPIAIIKDAIYSYFDDAAASAGAAGAGRAAFSKFDDLHPVVAATANFDEVLVPADHVSRSPNDTYYVDDATVLRCHTSAHQASTLRSGETAFLVTGDVYRRDSIDASHYPVFHQMEGVRVFEEAEWTAAGLPDGTALAERELKAVLEGLAAHLFGPDTQTRWVDAYFPFTHPSFELEVLFNGEWLEVLGCGVMQPAILANAGLEGRVAWAFGLGLERLAMVLFQIPDIRLFWSGDQRFTSQFKAGSLATRFKPYSKFPPCFKDVSFWHPSAGDVSENDLCEVVRGVAGDLAEAVTLIDAFTHPKTGRASSCYRIAYRSMERSLEDEEINSLQERVRGALAGGLGVELR